MPAVDNQSLSIRFTGSSIDRLIQEPQLCHYVINKYRQCWNHYDYSESCFSLSIQTQITVH